MIYAVSPFAQKELVKKFCFGECGKILLGAVELCGGSFFLCRHDLCEYEEARTPVLGNLDNEDVCVRKLLEDKK